ncbi:light-sensor Protein kinase-like [Selaginella moellendorffii]|uniref:light-sensor Protein kinase-like n=1 Tax=Selaginella moellendorffii TaxID=88036 RepID=UPI000D1C4288|nr:light-sensor Protein kinase-like [Selaginella moellendorffii]|eukprot:XP_024543763.1 light-sensor Protein kinase-like [Selaginella moellendorffii]
MLLGNKSVINHKELKLTTHLGQGGFGTVYEAIWLGHKFAVKVFPQGDKSFAKELAVLEADKHPNVLHIAGQSLDEEKQRYSLVMEKMDMDLANYVLKKKKSLPLLSIVAVMLQVATGMTWLHSKNIIHRDLKPQNILVGEEDNDLVSIRIADFGVSRPDFISSLISKATAKQGTRNFMAPEVWTSERYTKKADVYSYGMLSYQLVTGNIPFKVGMDMEQVLRGERPEIPATCPEFLSQLMRECWSHDAKERPSFSDICERLKQLKTRIITGTDSIDELRAKLVAAARSSSSSSYSSSSSSSSHIMNLDSPVQAPEGLWTQNPPSPVVQVNSFALCNFWSSPPLVSAGTTPSSPSRTTRSKDRALRTGKVQPLHKRLRESSVPERSFHGLVALHQGNPFTSSSCSSKLCQLRWSKASCSSSVTQCSWKWPSKSTPTSRKTLLAGCSGSPRSCSSCCTSTSMDRHHLGCRGSWRSFHRTSTA